MTLRVFFILLIAIAFAQPGSAQQGATPPAPCQGNPRVIGEIFQLVCSGREAEARRLVDTQPTAQAMVFFLAAYAAANMERGNFEVGLSATREMVELERTIAAGGGAGQSGWNYRVEQEWPWRRWPIRHPALEHRMVPTWPVYSPPIVEAPFPYHVPHGIWAVQESLLSHPYERIRAELPVWIAFAFSTRLPMSPSSYYGGVLDSQSARQRVAYYLAQAGRDADAVALLRPVPAGTRGSTAEQGFAAWIIRVFVAIGDPHRALAALRIAGIAFDPLGKSGEWEVIHMLLRDGDVSSATRLLPTQAQRQHFTWQLAQAYLNRQDTASAVAVLREGVVAGHDFWSAESSYLHFAEVFARLGDEVGARSALNAAEQTVSKLKPEHGGEESDRLMRAISSSLLQFAAYRLRAMPFDGSFAALSDPLERLHFLALCINDAADRGDIGEARRLIQLIERAPLPASTRMEVASTYLGDEGRFQAALRFAERKDTTAAQSLVGAIRLERARAFAQKEVATVLSMDPAEWDVRDYVLNSRLSKSYN